MRIFSKLVFICNMCFLAAVYFRFVELTNKATGTNGHIIRIRPLENSLILLGYGAIFINFIFVCITLVNLFRKKVTRPVWVTATNVILFVAQVYYFFIYQTNA